jgi:SAM-dependent methyltransferase
VTADPADSYALGRSEAETRRLIVQHQLYGPFTRQFLTAAGGTAGTRVLDVGSGAGDVALLLAELVDPRGQVVGVDTSSSGHRGRLGPHLTGRRTAGSRRPQ